MGFGGVPAWFHDPTDHAGDEYGRFDAVHIGQLGSPPFKPVGKVTLLRWACFDDCFAVQFPGFVWVRKLDHG